MMFETRDLPHGWVAQGLSWSSNWDEYLDATTEAKDQVCSKSDRFTSPATCKIKHITATTHVGKVDEIALKELIGNK